MTVLCAPIFLLPLASPAQELDEEASAAIDEVVVTGSRIRRDDYSSATPITVVSGQSIIEQGHSNLGEALRQQTSVGTGGFNQSSILSGGGATSIDLRNLGPSRVLILINGRRVASFADALANEAADLTFVPTAMVDRVEILRDGASAVYGSDAVTGVVNVILKKDFDGAEFSLNTGAASEGDGQNHGIALTVGSSGENGNFVAGVEYRTQDPIKQRDRGWAFPTISNLNANGAVNGSFFSPGGVFLGNGGAVFCTRSIALGGDEITDVSGTTGCESLAPRQNVTSPDDVQLVRYDYALHQDLIIDSEVLTASFFGNHRLSERSNVFVESQFSKRLGTSHLDGNPGSFGTPAYPDGSFVPATNPNNPTGEDGFYYFRPTSTVGPRTSDFESNTIRVVAGVEGVLPFAESWNFEASALYTRVDADLTTDSVWNLGRFLRISDPDLCAVDSLCASVVNPSGALDTFRPGNWTDTEIQYLRQISAAISKFETTGLSAFVSGPAVELPAGELMVAFGLETRDENGFNKPDSITEAGESVANQVFTTDGGFTVDEFFAEADVPLLSDKPLARDLTLNLQWRYSDYDNFGSADVHRIGLDWALTDWLRVRANTSTAFRAPQVTDLFGGGTVSFDFFVPDICDGAASGIQPGSNAYQNCLLDGVDPAVFIQPTAQYPVLSGSNPDLTPEEADTATYGLVLTPGGVLEGLQLSVDFWDIEVENLISRTTSQSVLTNCYEGPVGLSAAECDQFDGRNPNSGIPANFINRLQNLASVETNGFDIGIRYQFDIGRSAWTTELAGTYVDENTFAPGAGRADDRGSMPRFVGNLRTSVAFDHWSLGWSVRHISGMDDPDFNASTNAFAYSEVDAYYKHDVRASYDWDRYRFSVGINNVTDEDPPYIFSSSNNTDTLLYDVVGPFWFARLTVRFEDN